MIDGGVLACFILLATSGSLLVSVSALVYQHTICFFLKIVRGIYNIYNNIYMSSSGGDLLS